MEVSTMEKLPRQVYTSEFRRQAVELVIREGLGIAEASRRLSLSPKTLTNWVRRARGGEPPAASAPRREVTEAEAELSRLRRENAELRMERDILKNVWLCRRGQARNRSCWYKAGRMQQMYPASLE
jgi:transposase